MRTIAAIVGRRVDCRPKRVPLQRKNRPITHGAVVHRGDGAPAFAVLQLLQQSGNTRVRAKREATTMKRTLVACGASALGVFALAGVATLTLAQQLQQSPYAPKVGDPPEVSNMRLVGTSDLQARSAYQPTIHKQGNRYIAYVGHHGSPADQPKPFNALTRAEELNGSSIVDVTD